MGQEIYYFLSYVISLGVITSLLLFLVLAKKKTKSLRFLIYTLIFVVTWFLVEFITIFFVKSEFYGIILWKIGHVSTMFAVLFFMYFISLLVKVRIPKGLSYIVIASIVSAVVLILFTDLVIKGVELVSYGGSVRILGDFSVYVTLIRPFYLFVTIYLLISAFRNTKKGDIMREQITYLFIGGILIVVSTTATDFILPLINAQTVSFNHIPVTIYLIIIYYIILRYEAFELGNIKFNIQYKVLLGIIIAAVTPIIIIYGVNAPSYSDVLLEKTHSEARKEISSKANIIDIKLNFYRDEMEFISEIPSLKALLRTKPGGIDSQTGLSYSTHRIQLEGIFIAIAKSNSSYTQLRYIDESGNEIVRVNSNENGIEVVSFTNLQNKNDRYYFQQSIGLQEGGVYVSSFDLNREDGVIEVPYKPVVRYSAPVYEKSKIRGVVVANIFDETIFDTFEEGNNVDILIDNKGFYISHPDKTKEWGLDLQTGENFLLDYPGISSQILSGAEYSIQFEEKIFVYSPIFFNENDFDQYIIAVSIIDRDVLLAPIDKLRNLTLLSVFISLILILLLSYYISKIITTPINRLHRNVLTIQNGDKGSEIVINSRDEVGELSRVFSKLITSSEIARTTIEKKVEEQTRNIEKQKEKIEEQRAAVLNILEDVSAEKEIASIERDKLNTTLKSIGDAVFVVDEKYNITLFNTAAEEISGYTTDESVGKKYDQVLKFLMEDTGKKNEEFIVNAVEKGISGAMANHTVLIRKDGMKVAVADSAAPIKNSEGDTLGAIVVFRDVTKEHAIDKAKSEFVSTASHQLRTPLVGVRWVVDRFIKKEKLTKEGKAYLGDVQKAMDRLSKLVDALLNVSRIESSGGIGVTPERLDLVEYIKDYMEENRPLITKKNLTYTFNKHPEKLEIETDPNVFRNIIQSLVSNAMEYTPDNGEIEIGLEKIKDRFTLTVRDTGIGIPKDEQKTIFDKFSRASNAQLVKTDGTGLGLYITKEAVNVLGGKIRFESEENKGTIFYVDLPVKSVKKEGEKKLT